MILNITAIRDKMEDPPRGQRLHNAFKGDWDQLTDAQILDVLKIIKSEHKDVERTFELLIIERKIWQ